MMQRDAYWFVNADESVSMRGVEYDGRHRDGPPMQLRIAQPIRRQDRSFAPRPVDTKRLEAFLADRLFERQFDADITRFTESRTSHRPRVIAVMKRNQNDAWAACLLQAKQDVVLWTEVDAFHEMPFEAPEFDEFVLCSFVMDDGPPPVSQYGRARIYFYAHARLSGNVDRAFDILRPYLDDAREQLLHYVPRRIR